MNFKNINKLWDKLTTWAKNLPNKTVARFSCSVMVGYYISFIPSIYTNTIDLINNLPEYINDFSGYINDQQKFIYNICEFIYRFTELYELVVIGIYPLNDLIIDMFPSLGIYILEIQFMYYIFTLTICIILNKLVWSFFYTKLFASLILLIAVRAGLPRFRYDGLSKLSWNSYIPHIIIVIIIIILGGGGLL